jgi:hypothetical protein
VTAAATEHEAAAAAVAQEKPRQGLELNNELRMTKRKRTLGSFVIVPASTRYSSLAATRAAAAAAGGGGGATPAAAEGKGRSRSEMKRTAPHCHR